MTKEERDAIVDCENRCTVLYENFLGLVSAMRNAQRKANRAVAEAKDYSEATKYINKAEELEQAVDRWIESEA